MFVLNKRICAIPPEHSLLTNTRYGRLDTYGYGRDIFPYLTHLSRMNFPISISRTSLFQILEVLGGIFQSYTNSNRTFCEQTVETLIRRRVLWRLIWVCAVCLCPAKNARLLARIFEYLIVACAVSPEPSFVCDFGWF